MLKKLFNTKLKMLKMMMMTEKMLKKMKKIIILKVEMLLNKNNKILNNL
jgi:hypothetical protein